MGQSGVTTFLHFGSSDQFVVSYISFQPLPAPFFCPRQDLRGCQRHSNVGSGAQGRAKRQLQKRVDNVIFSSPALSTHMAGGARRGLGLGHHSEQHHWREAASAGCNLGFVFQVPSSPVITSLRAGSSAWESGSSSWSRCSAMGWSSWLSLLPPATSPR